jgi:hypothetical protein
MRLASTFVASYLGDMATLKERFEGFMSVLDGVENIDTLMKECHLPGRQRADYLAFDRRVIIEQKSLDVDPDQKVQSFVDDLIRERGTLGTGQASLISLAHILEGLPDGNDLKKQLYHKLTKGIDDLLAKADKQTRDTRETFVVPYAIGIVVILNDNAQILEPDFVAVKAFETLRKRSPAGELRYPNNEVVIVISEAHRVLTDDHVELIPTETILSDAGNQRPIASTCRTFSGRDGLSTTERLKLNGLAQRAMSGRAIHRNSSR